PLERRLAPGSYLLVATAPGRLPVRYPFVVARNESIQLTIDLPAPTEVPEGWVYVPPGDFVFGTSDEGQRHSLLTVPAHTVTESVIRQPEVTMADGSAFLEAQPPARREDHRPMCWATTGKAELAHDPHRGWRFLSTNPKGVIRAAGVGEPLVYAGRSENAR